MKRLLLALALSALTGLTARAQILVNFGSASFTPDAESSSFTTITQTSTRLSVAGLDDGQTLGGYFTTPLDFSGVTTLYLTASTDGELPDSLFTVLLYNTDYTQTRTYESAFNDYGPAGTSYALTLVAEDSAFTDIAGFQLIANGVGSAVSFTLDNLAASPSAIPEPSTYAALAGLLALGLALHRRPRRA